MGLLQKIISELFGKSPKPETTDSVLSNKEKGNLFEQWVVKRFDRRYFTLQEWRSDKEVDGIYAESNKYPDLLLEFKLKKVTKSFAVECKWRQDYHNGNLEWAKQGQLQRYSKFAQEKQVPVFIVIGLGGNPDDPQEVFIVPLSTLRAEQVKKEYLEQFVRKNKAADFFFDAKEISLK